MPQDIPLEGSELLAFTPPSLASIEGAPAFQLRAVNRRDKRHIDRLKKEERLSYHRDDEVRAAIMRALYDGWGEDIAAPDASRIEAWWQAGEEYTEQRKEDPALAWAFPDAEEAWCKERIAEICKSSAELGKFDADNAEYTEMTFTIQTAVVVKEWSGLADAKRRLDRGYLGVDCVMDLSEALIAFERSHDGTEGVTPGMAWLELVNACHDRIHLTEEEAKNSASPSPSETTPAVSIPTNTSDSDGSSPDAMARSSKTPETA